MLPLGFACSSSLWRSLSGSLKFLEKFKKFCHILNEVPSFQTRMNIILCDTVCLLRAFSTSQPQIMSFMLLHCHSRKVIWAMVVTSSQSLVYTTVMVRFDKRGAGRPLLVHSLHKLVVVLYFNMCWFSGLSVGTGVSTVLEKASLKDDCSACSSSVSMW